MRGRRWWAATMVLVVAGAVVGAACGGGGSGDRAAVTLGTRTISHRQVVHELDVIAANHQRVAVLEEVVPVRGSAEGSYDARFVAQVVQGLIVEDLVAAAVHEAGLEADDLCRYNARQLAIDEQGMGRTDRGRTVFDAYPPAYQDRLVNAMADQLLLMAHLVGTSCVPGDAARDHYLANPDEFAEACLRIIVAPTEAEARQAAEEARSSGDFAAVAARRSQEPSAADGGSVGCRHRNKTPIELQGPGFTTPVGAVSEPVPHPSGYVVVQVERRDIVPLEEVRDEAVELAAAAASNAYTDWYLATLRATPIELDPAYGRWDPTTGSIQVAVADPG